MRTNEAARGLVALFRVIFLPWLASPELLHGANVLNDPGFEENPAGIDVHPIAGWQWVYDLTVPLEISISQTNGNLLLSWPANIICHLQAQTTSAGLGTNWFDVAGASNPFVAPFASFNSSVFYRLKSP